MKAFATCRRPSRSSFRTGPGTVTVSPLILARPSEHERRGGNSFDLIESHFIVIVRIEKKTASGRKHTEQQWHENCIDVRR